MTNAAEPTRDIQDFDLDDELEATDDWDDEARIDLDGPDPEDLEDLDDEPTLGAMELADRHALRRVAGLSTELEDMSEVEYRQLRLERVALVGVWTSGSQQDAENSMAELALLAETAGSEVLEALYQRRQ